MTLQIQYSKELAKELGKIPVYLPGEQIEVGDIITFPHGKAFFGRSKPLGTFIKITSLKKLGVQYDNPKYSGSPDTYRYASKNSVEFDFLGGIQANIPIEQTASGKVKIQFGSEGAIYFLAIDCDKKELNDLASLEKEIISKGKKLIWEDTFLVTSVTVAKKAFVAQSRSKTSELNLIGDFKGNTSGITEIQAETSLKVGNQSGDLFVKDWSDNVPVFMDLIKFEKEVFDSSSNRNRRQPKIIIRPVKIEELLIP
jgi:hypothetical protein